MERQIGEVFTYNGKTYQVAKTTALCGGCAFLTNSTCHKLRTILGSCGSAVRKDHEEVIFKEIDNMENNQLNIKIPEGMEIDIENTDLIKGIIKFRESYINYNHIYDTITVKYGWTITAINVSKNNITKLSNLDKLLDIAKYYNKDWEPDWNATYEYKYYIFKHNNKYYIASTTVNNCRIVYFRNIEDAQAVIDNSNFKDILDNIYK